MVRDFLERQVEKRGGTAPLAMCICVATTRMGGEGDRRQSAFAAGFGGRGLCPLDDWAVMSEFKQSSRSVFCVSA
jgi:hypothetical protein